MPTDGLPIELDAVRELIRQLAPNVGDEFTTIQIIELYSGGYHINRGIAPACLATDTRLLRLLGQESMNISPSDRLTARP